MGSRIVLDWTRVHDVLPVEASLSQMLPGLVTARNRLGEERGLPTPDLVKRLGELLDVLPTHSDALVVVGSGTALQAARALEAALAVPFSGLHSRRIRTFWCGHHMANDALADLLDALDELTPTLVLVGDDEDLVEPPAMARVLRAYLEDRFGRTETRHRVLVFSPDAKSSLTALAEAEGYTMVGAPSPWRGGFSPAHPAALFALGAAGFSPSELVAGARQAREDALSPNNNSVETNVVLAAAGLRTALVRAGYRSETFCVWSPKLERTAQWWRGLVASTDTADVLFPSTAVLSTELSALERSCAASTGVAWTTHLWASDESSLARGAVKRRIRVPALEFPDGCEAVHGRDLVQLQADAKQAALLALTDAKVPSLVWEVPELSGYWLSYWMESVMLAVTVSALERGQTSPEGGDVWIRNLSALLGREGLGGADVRARLERGQRLRALGLSTR